MAPLSVIVGAGALGQAFAAHLATAGASVVLLATSRTAAALHATSHVRLGGVVDLEVPVVAPPARPGSVAVTDDTLNVPSHAGVVFATKAHQLAAACAAVRVADPDWVAGVQNGLLKDDILTSAFGRERVLGMVTIFSAGRQPSGGVAVSGLGRTYVGELDGHTSQRAMTVATQLCDAGIPTEYDADIRSVSWSKACNAAGVFGVSVLTRTTGAELLGHPDLLRAYLALVRETEAIARANGVQVGDYFGFPIRTYVQRSDEDSIQALGSRAPVDAGPATQRVFPSMTQDLLAGRPMESDEIFADLEERAARVHVPVPRLTLVRDLCRGLDARGNRSSNSL
jgi:2-dehydropantoate 2-reductase